MRVLAHKIKKIIIGIILLLGITLTIHAEESKVVKIPITIELEHGLNLKVENGKAIIYRDSNMTQLYLMKMSNIRSIEGLHNFPNLKEINFDYCSIDIQDFENNFLMELPRNLESFGMDADINIPDIGFIERYPYLKTLGFEVGDRESFTAPRMKLEKNLNYLSYFGGYGLHYEEFSFLKHMPNVETVYLYNLNPDVHTFHVEMVGIMEKLKEISITGIPIENLEFLKYMPNLEDLHIHEGQFSHNDEKNIAYSKGAEYDDKIWAHVPKLKELVLPPELLLDRGVLSKYTQAEETQSNTKMKR